MTKEEKMLFDSMTETYKDTYYSEIYNIQTIKGYDHIQGLNQEVLERIIKKPWTNENVNFSERIWGKERTINRVLEKELTKGIIRGDDIKRISKKVSDIMNTSFKNAKRLVITENAHIHSVARHDSYKKMNIEKYEILATLDNRTSEICQDMDGKIFNMEDYQEGITSPPFHPHCRSCILPVIDDDIQKEMEDEVGRIARDIKSGKTKVVGNVGFNCWYEKYIEKSVSKDYNYDIVNDKDCYVQKSFYYTHPFTNKKEFIPKNTIFEYVKTIYKGDQIRTVNSLIKKYGGVIDDWEKKVGKIETDLYIFDMHWYEKNRIQYEMKLKSRKDKK